MIAVALNIVGIVLLFVGNMIVTQAVTRYNAGGNPRFIWGNRLQAVGFALSLVAILLGVLSM